MSASAKPSERERLQRLAAALETWQRTLMSTRAFFVESGFLEVATPSRVPTPALEDHIEAEPSGTWFLRTSPELHMKRLLAAGYPRIFQIGPCFRQGECGRRHLPEFTMLEWYRTGATYRDVLADCKTLLCRIAQDTLGTTVCRFRGVDVAQPWRELSVSEAFRDLAGQDVDEAVAAGVFEEVLVTAVEPRLDLAVPTVLLDYPLACAGLSKRKPGSLDRVERWELYVGGLELANACTELTDYGEQKRRFQASAARRRDDKRAVYAEDEAFLSALHTGMPDAAGVAVGLDRVVMLLTGCEDIADITAFPPPRAQP